MAIAVGSGDGWTAYGQGCGYVDAHASVMTYLDSLTWGRDPGNCERGNLSFSVNGSVSYSPSLVWATCGYFNGNYVQIRDNLETKGSVNHTIPKQGVPGNCPGGGGFCCLCGGVVYYYSNGGGNFTGSILTDVNTTAVFASANMIDNYFMSELTYNLPDYLRILPPTNLRATFPSNAGGKVTATWTNWSKNPNIKGTPTSYPNHKIYNVRLELLSENGTYIAQQLKNVGENKSVSFDSMGLFYKDNVLDTNPQAQSSRVALTPGTKYKVRLTINNDMNQTQSATSELITVDIPTPTVSIESFLYEEDNANHSKLKFRWSKASSGADEKITYEVWQNGEKVNEGVLKDNSQGLGLSGVQEVSVKSGERTIVKVFNKSLMDDQVKSAEAEALSPVAKAAFASCVWDERRHIATITATALGAANTRLGVGRSSNNYDLSNELTVGNTGTATIENPEHGEGQVLYLEAVPVATDGTRYEHEAAKLSIPIPNPILGVTADKGSEHRYIVDIVEHKKNDKITPKWQTTWPRFIKN